MTTHLCHCGQPARWHTVNPYDGVAFYCTLHAPYHANLLADRVTSPPAAETVPPLPHAECDSGGCARSRR